MTTAMVHVSRDLQLAVGLGAAMGLYEVRRIPRMGLGIPGPWAGKDVPISKKTYEITGTEVGFFATSATLPPPNTVINPSTPGVQSFFNTAYGANGGKVAGTPDQVDANGEVKNVGGRRWAFMVVKSTQNAGAADPEHPGAKNVSPGQEGWAPVDYMADPGWTAANGGTGPIPPKEKPVQPPPAPPGPGPLAKKTDWATLALIGAGVVGVGAIGWALWAGKKRGGRRAFA